ncbi:hypothetical protein PT2222_140330 [Paraburkholderia tropica]
MQCVKIWMGILVITREERGVKGSEHSSEPSVLLSTLYIV